MEITLPTQILRAMLADAAELGAIQAMSMAGLITPYISKQEAYKKYSRGTVDRWVKEGLVIPKKDGGSSSKWRIDRQEIEAVAKASNRPSYKLVTQRK